MPVLFNDNQRLPSGSTNMAQFSPLGGLRTYCDLQYGPLVQEDFWRYFAGDWVQSGGGTYVIEAAGAGGVLDITTTAVLNNEAAIQFAGQSGSVSRQFTPANNRDLLFFTSLKMSEASVASFLAGLTAVATAPIGTPPTDGVYFLKGTGTRVPSLVIRTGGVSTTFTPGTNPVGSAPFSMADNTFYDMGFAYEGSTGNLHFWFGPQGSCTNFLISNFPNTHALLLPQEYSAGNQAANLTTAALAPNFSILNGAASAKVLSLDSYVAARLR